MKVVGSHYLINIRQSFKGQGSLGRWFCHVRMVFFPPKDSSPFSGRPESQLEKDCGDPGGPGGIILAFVEFSIAYFRHSCHFIISVVAPPTLTDDFTGCRRGRAGLYFTEQLPSLYTKSSLEMKQCGVSERDERETRRTNWWELDNSVLKHPLSFTKLKFVKSVDDDFSHRWKVWKVRGFLLFYI